MEHSNLSNNDSPSPWGKLLAFAGRIAPFASLVALELADKASAAERISQAIPLPHLVVPAGMVALIQLLHSRHTREVGVESHREHQKEEDTEHELERLHNRHLARAVGMTIGDILKEMPADVIVKQDRAAMTLLAGRARDLFVEVVGSGLAPTEFLDAQLPGLIEKATQKQAAPLGEIGMWKAVLRLMVDRSEITLLSSTFDAAAEACQRSFIDRFFNTIKSDLKVDGASFASIQLRMMHELLDYARKHANQLQLSNEMLTNLGKLNNWLDGANDWLAKLGKEIGAVGNAVKEADEKSAARDASLSKGIDQLLEEIKRRLPEKPKQPSVGGTAELKPDQKEIAQAAERSSDSLVRAKTLIILGNSFGARRELKESSNVLDNAFSYLSTMGDSFYLERKFDQALPYYQSALGLPGRSEDPIARGNVALALQRSQLGDTGTWIDQAIDLHLGTLKLQNPYSETWAATQNNLGIAWQNKRTGNKEENIKNAIKAYEAALKVYSSERFPLEWEAINHNLDAAHLVRNWATEPPSKNEFVQELVERVSRQVRQPHPSDLIFFKWVGERLVASFGATENLDLRRPRLTFSAYPRSREPFTFRPAFLKRLGHVELLTKALSGDKEPIVPLRDNEAWLFPSKLPQEPAIYLLQATRHYRKEEAEFMVAWGVNIPQDTDVSALSQAQCYYDLWIRYIARTSSEWAHVTNNIDVESLDADFLFRYFLARDVIKPVEQGLEQIENNPDSHCKIHAFDDLPSLARLRWIKHVRTPLIESLGN